MSKWRMQMNLNDTAVVLALAFAGCAAPALAEQASIVHVTISDKGGSSLDGLGNDKPMGLAMGGDTSKATMSISLSPAEVKAGEITFEAANGSKDFIHEVIVAPLKDLSQPLPYNSDENSVDEDKASAIGEVSELDPGVAGKVTLHLAPGEYIVFCNVPGHYAMGMWTTLKVDG